MNYFKSGFFFIGQQGAARLVAIRNQTVEVNGEKTTFLLQSFMTSVNIFFIPFIKPGVHLRLQETAKQLVL